MVHYLPSTLISKNHILVTYNLNIMEMLCKLRAYCPFQGITREEACAGWGQYKIFQILLKASCLSLQMQDALTQIRKPRSSVVHYTQQQVHHTQMSPMLCPYITIQQKRVKTRWIPTVPSSLHHQTPRRTTHTHKQTWHILFCIGSKTVKIKWISICL